MPSIESNNEDWKEIRSRVDSIANAIFLISGGALSLSISVILSNKTEPFITSEVSCLASSAWYSLLGSILILLLLKGLLVFQAFMLQVKPGFVNKWLNWLNGTSWFFGLLGFALFIFGMYRMVQAAVVAINT